MIKTEYLLLIALLFLLTSFLSFNFVFGGISNSTYDLFNATNLTSFNWTTSNITIGSFNDSIRMTINNYTTYINDEYGQKGRMSAETPNWYTCFPPEGDNNISFIVQNQTGSYTNFTSILNNNATEEFTLSIFPFCPPGKYYGYFNVTRVGNTSDIVNVYTTIHIPLSLSNTLVQNSTEIEGYFKGTFSINDSYHSYYFNTSELNLTNITGLTISLTDLNEDLDIFVFNSSGYLMGKSINKDSSVEQIIDLDLPSTPDMWEIRIYGNVSSGPPYRGDLYFSTLNITNVTDSTKVINALDFGDLDPNATASNNVTLINEDIRNLTGVNEFVEIYRIQIWPLENQTKSFYNLLVPTFAKKIKVKINWTDEAGKNITDWNLYLRDHAGNLIGSSTDKFILSNATNATREEYVEFNGPFNTSEGYWNITVQNATNATMPFSYYNLTAYIWMNESNWVSTNYTNGLNFNRGANYSYHVHINLTIPETQVLDGAYAGFMKYNNSQGWNTKLPISFNISAGTLVINQTLNNGTIRLSDNVGFNRLDTNALTLNLTFNNTGNSDIYYSYNTSDYRLVYGTNNISFSVEGWPSNPITAGSNGLINITISINNTNATTSGVYKGWIFFNATNTTLSSSSYPYNTYNLSLEVNLTDSLILQIVEVNTGDGNSWIENVSTNHNVTLVTKVFLVNGTQIFDDVDQPNFGFNINNFTFSKMTETNITSTTYSNTNITQRTAGADNLCAPGTGKCFINVTTQTSMKGGRYRISLGIEWNNSQSLLIGNATNSSVVVNGTGLSMTALNTMQPSLYEGGTSTYLNVTVINYGPVRANGGMTFSGDVSDCGTVETDSTNCSFTAMSLDGNGTEVCLFVWKFTSKSSVSSHQYCDFTIYPSTDTYFGSAIPGELTTLNNASSAGDDTGDSSSTSSGAATSNATATVSGTTNYLDIIDYLTSISIEQGASQVFGVTVNNTNQTLTQNIILYINNINSSWYSINPSTSVKLKRGQSYVFEVTFNIPSDATVGDHSGKFNATSFFQYKTVTKIYDVVLKDFTLKVTPGAALQSEIKSKLSSYTNDMNNLEQEINQSKDQGYNTSEVESLLSQLKSKLDQANDYVDSGDYTSAYNLLDDIASLINQTRDGLTGLPITGKAGGILGDWWSWGKWVITVVVVVVVAVLGYMFWPTKLGEPKPTPIVQQVVEEKKNKIAETFAKLKERWKKVKEKQEAEKHEP